MRQVRTPGVEPLPQPSTHLRSQATARDRKHGKENNRPSGHYHVYSNTKASIEAHHDERPRASWPERQLTHYCALAAEAMASPEAAPDAPAAAPADVAASSVAGATASAVPADAGPAAATLVSTTIG